MQLDFPSSTVLKFFISRPCWQVGTNESALRMHDLMESLRRMTDRIEEFSRKYVVAVGLVREYILHLEHLDLLKRKREREESQKKSERKEKTYKNYNWRQLC